jgi:ankyrin repeat protein
MTPPRRLPGLVFAGVVACALTSCEGRAETPLQTAIRAHDTAAVRLLLAQGAGSGASFETKVSARELAFTSLEPAAESPSVEVLRLMLAANPQPKRLGTAAAREDRLVDASFAAACSRRPCGDVSAIELVVRSWNPAAVQAMLDAGLTVSSQGTTDALVYAIADGNDAAARLLLQAGADPDQASTGRSGPEGGSTARQAARKKGSQALLELMR